MTGETPAIPSGGEPGAAEPGTPGPSLGKASANAARSVAVQFASLGTSLIDRIILAAILLRLWGTEGFSDWATIVSASSMVVIVELGFQQFVGNLLLKAHVRDRGRAFSTIVGWAMFTSLAIALAVSLAIALAAVFLPLREYLHLYETEFVPALVILCVTNAIKIARGPVVQIYRGIGEFYNFIWSDARATLLSVIASIVAVLLGAGVVTISSIYLAMTVLMSVILPLRDFRARFPHIRFVVRRPSWRATRRGLLALRWYGLFFVISNLMQTAPILIIATLGLVGNALASFAVTRTLVNFGRTVAFGLSNAAGAELSVIRLHGHAPTFERGLRLTGRLNACIAGLAACGLMMFNTPLITVWTGKASLSSDTILLLLLVPAIAVAPALALQQSAVMLDRVREQSIASAVGAVLVIFGGIFLGRTHGIVGVAAAAAVGETLALGIIAPISAARELRISYLSLLRDSGAVFLAVCAWSILIGWATTLLPLGDTIAAELARLVVWGSLAAPPAAWLCATPALRHRAQKIFRRLTPAITSRFTNGV